MRLSIVIPSYNSGDTIESCLGSLTPQCDESVEIIVVDSGEDDARRRVEEHFPDVVLIRSERRQYPGAARNLGIEHARGELLGFIDADCVAAPDWIARILAAHTGEHPVVGGVIGNEAPRGRLDWAAYLCSFHRWMPGTPAGTVVDIPTCCLSFPRWVFDRYGPFRSSGFSTDTELNWRVTRDGYPLLLDPGIRVSHVHHPTLLSFARRQLTRGYAFARMRVAHEGFSRRRRLLYAGGIAALPFLLTARLAGRALQRATPREYQRGLVVAAPLVFLGFSLWACGEMAGYAHGGAA